MAAKVVTTTRNVDANPVGHWTDSLEALPTTLFRGFDRKAVRQLIARLDESYGELMVERKRLLEELDRLQRVCEAVGQSEERLTAEIDGVRAELENSRQEKQSLADRLERARARWNVELDRAQADLKRELDRAEEELAGYRRREVLLASARSRADAVKAEARDEAERALRHARKRVREMLRNAECEVDRLEAERARLQALAAGFRQDLATRLSEMVDELNDALPPAQVQAAASEGNGR